MGMFNSQYDCKIDAKGRMALPAKIRSAIPESNGANLFLRCADDGCLTLLTQLEYKKIQNQVNALSDHNPETRKLKRSFFAMITEVELDSAGRILVPKGFLSFAALEKDAVVVGVGSYVEIWNPERYRELVFEDPADLSDLMQKYLS
ncbi:mraz protein [Nitritalea halalkaliphila LW7]|uniref:Transcriptional regulator MraZ n=2 Tax=Nitritalea TaxID=1187887 RepID=I5C2C9_9BACT|nr:mraz protein [Nitritalea halalkaliphila LW7]